MSPSTYEHCCEISHAVVLAKPGPDQGKVLLIQGTGQIWLWDPAAPSSATFVRESDPLDPTTVSQTEPRFENLFCCGHSADGEGDIVIAGGDRTRVFGSMPMCGQQPTWSYVLNPTSMEFGAQLAMLVPHPTPTNFGYWYPGTVRLHDGRVLSAGGGSAPLHANASPCWDAPGIQFADGWQIFDPATGAWSGLATDVPFPGLPTGGNGYDYDFNYYPLLMMIPPSPGTTNATGYVFAPVVPDNNGGRHQVQGQPYVFPRSASAIMNAAVAGWPASGAWTIHGSQITNPAPGGLVRNLYYPNAVLRPLVLNSQGLPAGPVQVMVCGGSDANLTPTLPLPGPGPGQLGGGGIGLRDVSQISAPEQPASTWTSNQPATHPNMLRERIYANSVLLPDGQLLVIGGSKYDYYPYAGGAPGAGGAYIERAADPVLEPELLDLLPPAGTQPTWRLQATQVSPRLYHSSAVLLRDGRVLVVGGHRGVQPFNQQGQPTSPFLPAHYTWANFLHYDVEIFSPDYMNAGRRPQISSLISGGVVGASTIAFGSAFEIEIVFPGSSAAAIGAVTLIAPGSSTHHFDWDQRYVGLSFSPVPGSGKKLAVQAPAHGGVAPPGWYMLFAVSDGSTSGGIKIPSIARFVRLQ
jgi:Domain of unknown function (DUF1929)